MFSPPNLVGVGLDWTDIGSGLGTVLGTVAVYPCGSLQNVDSSPDRLARFQREVLASLNYPNIAAIHGIEKSDATQALVMELVEWATLAGRIKQGGIPVNKALPITNKNV